MSAPQPEPVPAVSGGGLEAAVHVPLLDAAERLRSRLVALPLPLRTAGVASLRLSPQDCDMVAVARLFRDVADERLDPEEAESHLGAAYPGVPLANGFLHGAPGHLRMGAGAGGRGELH